MKIKQGVISKRSPVYEVQACYLALVVRSLEAAFLRQFRRGTQITQEHFDVFREMSEYKHFNEAASVCGFVCTDYRYLYEIEVLHEMPTEAAPKLSFAEIRHYVHTLQRTERWNSEFSKALWNAVMSGALRLIAERIESDPSLYQVNSSAI